MLELNINPKLNILLIVIALILCTATIIGWIMKKLAKTEKNFLTIANLNYRIYSWWIMVGILTICCLMGKLGTTILFMVISFLALREFITITPTGIADHRTLFWAFFLILPGHYWLLYNNWYGMFVIFIPVYAFLFLSIRSVLRDEPKDFLRRTSEIQWGIMLNVYLISHAPALLMLKLKGFPENENPLLLLFLISVVQLGDVSQYVWGNLFGKSKIVPNTSPNKTSIGLIGGILSGTIIGAGLSFLTPFAIWESALVGGLLVILGFLGDVTSSAIKRDRGIKDYGTTIPGHGGIMDRIDSLCFAAPVFFHYIRYFYYWAPFHS